MLENKILDWRRFDGTLNPELTGLTYIEMLQLIAIKVSATAVLPPRLYCQLRQPIPDHARPHHCFAGGSPSAPGLDHVPPHVAGCVAGRRSLVLERGP